MRIITALLCLVVSADAFAADQEFSVSWSKETYAKPFTGRVYVFFSKRRSEPRFGPSWFSPELFIAKDVTAHPAGKPVEFTTDDKSVLSYPKPFGELDLKGMRAQAVARFNPFERVVGRGAGNGYSKAVALTDGKAEFNIDQIVPQRKFRENKWSKPLLVESKLLAGFHGRKVLMKAAVMLPASYYDNPETHYPTIYTIPGFGGSYFSGQRSAPISESNDKGVEFIRVLLDANCQFGHHVFADSANNGPVGKALVEELIPALEKKFRALPVATARFLTGHSSGGWSSLWLQVTYPDTFGGTWSTSPDPVDFRDFQQINMYQKGINIYRDENKRIRPLGRMGNRVVLTYPGFDHMEVVLGYGGQLKSFEAVFSPRGKDGLPKPAWDRKTGQVDTSVTEHWKKYDIRLTLENNWKTLGPKLRGKLNVFMGEADNFYLEGATKLLKESLAKLKSDAVVELYPGRNHGNLLTPKLRSRIRQEMAEQFVKHHTPGKTAGKK